MEIKLDINDIISQDELKEIARYEIVKNIKEKVNKEADRLLSNMAYYASFSFINEIFTDEQKEIVKKRTSEILNNLSSYTVFNREYYERNNGTAYQVMNQTVYDNREKIVEKTLSLIENFDYAEKLESDCAEILKDAIIKKLEKREE